MSLKAVLFDLDGTLADTATDLALALNRQLEKHGRQPLPFEQLRPLASHGSLALLRAGFDIGPEDDNFTTMRQEYLDVYASCMNETTKLFPGVRAHLDWLESQGLRWGIITNKPENLTWPLLDKLALTSRSACVIGGDTAGHAKPHPAPMLMALDQLQLDAKDCVYVGDAERDIQAGNAVEMPSLAALWGYIEAADKPAEWGAIGMCDSISDVQKWLVDHYDLH